MSNNNLNGKKIEDYSKEELIEAVKDLRKRKKFGLVWEEKLEDVVEQCKKELPVLESVETKTIQESDEKPTHLIIEGDNYHALSVLNYTHANKIDVIYIDPPYNTGNQSWKYNNNYVERDDPWLHTKWLSMMNQRLILAKNLLKNDGALIVAIDDYEVNHLGLLLEELFPNYERDLVIVAHHPQGAGSNTVSRVHEYAFICTPNGLGFKGRKNRDGEDYWSLKRSGQGENVGLDAVEISWIVLSLPAVICKLVVL
jgi:adenine-specific DNA-methyltransferase